MRDEYPEAWKDEEETRPELPPVGASGLPMRLRRAWLMGLAWGLWVAFVATCAATCVGLA